MKKFKRIAKRLVVAILAAYGLVFVVSLAVFVLNWTGCVPETARGRKRAFQKFFGPPPSSVKVVHYGYERDLSGEGAFAILFTVSEPDFLELMRARGFMPTDVNADPDRWDPEMCASTIRRVTGVGVPIASTDICYAKQSPTNSCRVFFNRDAGSAALLWLGWFSHRLNEPEG